MTTKIIFPNAQGYTDAYNLAVLYLSHKYNHNNGIPTLKETDFENRIDYLIYLDMKDYYLGSSVKKDLKAKLESIGIESKIS